MLFFYICSVIGFACVEHLTGRGYLLGDWRSAIIVTGATCITVSGLEFYSNQARLRRLLDWCQTVATQENANQIISVKTVKLFHSFAYSVPIYSSLGSIFLYYTTKVPQMPIALYYVPELMNNFITFTAIFLFQTIVNLVFWKYTCFILTTYILLIKHASGQYKMLSESVKKLTCRSNESDEVNHIGKLHSELLENLRETSTLFNRILILNELFCILCIVIAIIILTYEFEQAVFGFAVLLITALSFQYPLLGEEVSSRAEDFSKAVYECDWLELTVDNRKKIALIFMMLQKPVGNSSGGFHHSNFREVSQILRSAYNMLIFIKRKHDLKGF